MLSGNVRGGIAVVVIMEVNQWHYLWSVPNHRKKIWIICLKVKNLYLKQDWLKETWPIAIDKNRLIRGEIEGVTTLFDKTLPQYYKTEI